MNEAQIRELYLKSKQRKLIKIILVKEKLIAESRHRLKKNEEERSNQRQKQQQHYKKIIVSLLNSQDRNQSAVNQKEDMKYESVFAEISRKVEEIIKLLSSSEFNQSFKDTIKQTSRMDFIKQTAINQYEKRQKDDETVLRPKIFNINQFKFMNENINQKNIKLSIEVLLARIQAVYLKILQNQSCWKSAQKQLEYTKEEIESLNKELKQAIKDKQKIKSMLSQVECLRYKEISLCETCLSSQEQNTLLKLTSQQLVKKIGLLKIQINKIFREKNEISQKLTKFCMQQKDRYNLFLIKLKTKRNEIK